MVMRLFEIGPAIARRGLHARGLLVASTIALLFTACSELDYLRYRAANQEQRIRELEASLEKWQEGYNALYKQNVGQNEEYRKQLTLRDQEISRLRSMRSDRERNLSAREGELKLQLQKEKDTNDTLQAQLRKQTETSQGRIAALSKDLDDLEKAKATLAGDLKTAQSEARSARERVAAADRARNTAQEMEKAAKTENEQLKGKLEERDRKINDYEKQIAELQDSVKNTSASENKLSTDLEKLKKTLADERRIAETERKKQSAEIARLHTQLAKLKGSPAATDPTLTKAKGELTQALDALVKQKAAEVISGPGRVAVRIYSDTLFEPATVLIRQSGRDVLSKVAAVLKAYPGYQLRIEGHTDNQPVRNMPFPDNLALSSQRADNVLRYLMEATELPQKQIRSGGCSFWIPVATNDTPEGRKRNRRVEIILAVEE